MNIIMAFNRYGDAYTDNISLKSHITGRSDYGNNDECLTSNSHSSGLGVAVPPVPRKNSFETGSYRQYKRNTLANGDDEVEPDIQRRSMAMPLQSTTPTGRWRGIKWKELPYFVYTVSLIQIGVFISELARMGTLTGSPIQTQPSFNPMIGPSSYVMINMGARFPPCMHNIPNITNVDNLNFPCPNSTTANTDVCTLSELCGMGGIPPNTFPHQWWRFITPIFIHAGFIHIGFNLLLQLKLGGQLERDLGLVRFIIVYFSSGIAGFVLGGNFAPDGIASTGASGSLFGVIALDLLDLLFNWQTYQHPKRNLIFHIIEIIVSFVLGLLPGLDNFSHIGGFAMGLLTGTAILRSPWKLRQISYTEDHFFTYNSNTDMQGLVQHEQPNENNKQTRISEFNWRHPHENFQNRSKWWYMWLVVRAGAIVLAIVYFVVLIRQFNNGGGNCSWCKYLSCLPVNGWCDQGTITTS